MRVGTRKFLALVLLCVPTSTALALSPEPPTIIGEWLARGEGVEVRVAFDKAGRFAYVVRSGERVEQASGAYQLAGDGFRGPSPRATAAPRASRNAWGAGSNSRTWSAGNRLTASRWPHSLRQISSVRTLSMMRSRSASRSVAGI